MIAWLLKFIPAEYKWGVAAKNIAYDIGKAAGGILMWSKAVSIATALHISITPEMQMKVSEAVGVLATGVLAWVHDYLQVKFPNNPLL